MFKRWTGVRLAIAGCIALLFVLLLGGVGSTPLSFNRPANAQLSPDQVPPPAPSRPIPNDLRQPLIPGKVALTEGTEPYPILHDLPNSSYTPEQDYAIADPTNYGYRFLTDASGNPVQNRPIVVIHETVGSASSAINTFQTYHPRDADQRSYHALIKRDGTVVYIVPTEYRAFGAGNSVFESSNGIEAVRTNPQLPPSVNNFAYHVSLETPSDGRGNGARHSGYTQLQYQSLAWLVARTSVPETRITTHRAVDRSGSRRDPRSFDNQRFLNLLETYART